MISWEQYFDRIVSLHLQFDMGSKAVSGFSSTPEAVEKHLESELEAFRKMAREGAERDGVDASGSWVYTTEGAEKYLNELRTTLPSRLRDFENRLRQNELVLRVAIFEAFMKDLHREVLRQEPSILKSDRQVPLGKILSAGLDVVLADEIEREVQILDRKSVSEKARYFLERLGIDWFDGKIVPFLERVIKVRNRIMHEDPDYKIKDEDIGTAQVVCFSIPWVTVIQAAVLYPGGFTQVEGITPDEVKRIFLKKPAAPTDA